MDSYGLKLAMKKFQLEANFNSRARARNTLNNFIITIIQILLLQMYNLEWINDQFFSKFVMLFLTNTFFCPVL